MTTRLVVLADTHMPAPGRELPAAVLQAIGASDAVIHLGDFVDESVADFLERHAPLYAVHGNNDVEAIMSRYPAWQFLRVEGHRLALIHGDIGGKTALQAARSVGQADAVLFGHSHQAYVGREQGRLLFNPGSPTERRFRSGTSFGILTVGETIEARIVPVRR